RMQGIEFLDRQFPCFTSRHDLAPFEMKSRPEQTKSYIESSFFVLPGSSPREALVSLRMPSPASTDRRTKPSATSLVPREAWPSMERVTREGVGFRLAGHMDRL